MSIGLGPHIKDKMVKLVKIAISKISNVVTGMFVLDKDNSDRPTVFNGANWKGLAYKDEITGLEQIDEGNGKGLAKIGRVPGNYGNIGSNAVDLSHSDTPSETRGATGNYAVAEGYRTEATADKSHAEGEFTKATGISSHAEGRITKSSGNYSHSEGENNESSGLASHTEGSNNIASGPYTHAEGERNFARSKGEHSGGRFGTDYTPSIDDETVHRLVNYGNGTSDALRNDAFTIFRNGAVRFFRATLVSIANAAKEGLFILNSDDANRPYIHNGTDWKGLAYTEEITTAVKQTNTIDYQGKNQFGTPSAPRTGNLIADNTGAKLGKVQKIYHSDSVVPTFTAEWKKSGTGEYVTGALNIIYSEWVSDARKEYWVTQTEV